MSPIVYSQKLNARPYYDCCVLSEARSVFRLRGGAKNTQISFFDKLRWPSLAIACHRWLSLASASWRVILIISQIFFFDKLRWPAICNGQCWTATTSAGWRQPALSTIQRQPALDGDSYRICTIAKGPLPPCDHGLSSIVLS